MINCFHQDNPPLRIFYSITDFKRVSEIDNFCSMILDDHQRDYHGEENAKNNRVILSPIAWKVEVGLRRMISEF